MVARELSTPSGPIDAVGLDNEGGIYLIETKLYRNQDKRRVLAQVLDYGAALWKHKSGPKPFRESLEGAARRTLGSGLATAIAARFSIEPSDVEELLATAEKRAQEGSFRFVILMDRIDDALRDLIGYINENSRFDVFGVELRFFRVELLIEALELSIRSESP
ncbi:MAG: hypothetical protein MI919_36495 [Holophagales bacterium]|nr:hypothetical protein [Holophagales bacterium]